MVQTSTPSAGAETLLYLPAEPQRYRNRSKGDH